MVERFTIKEKMSNNKKYYRTVYRIEVLSDEPMPDMIDLDTIHYEVTEGH